MTKRSQKFAIQPRRPAVTTIGRRALNVRSTRRVKHPPRRRPLKTRTRRRQQTSVVRTKEHGVSHRLGGGDADWVINLNKDFIVIRIWIFEDKVFFQTEFDQCNDWLHIVSGKGIICISKIPADDGKRQIWWYHPITNLSVSEQKTHVVINKLDSEDVSKYADKLSDIKSTIGEISNESKLMVPSSGGDNPYHLKLQVLQNGTKKVGKPFYVYLEMNDTKELISYKVYACCKDDIYTPVAGNEPFRKSSGRRMMMRSEEYSDHTIQTCIGRLQDVFKIPKDTNSFDFLKDKYMMTVHISTNTRQFIALPCICLDKTDLDDLKQIFCEKNLPDSLEKYVFPQSLQTYGDVRLTDNDLQNCIMLEYVRSRLYIRLVQALHEKSFAYASGITAAPEITEVITTLTEEVLSVVPFAKQLFSITVKGAGFVKNWRKEKKEKQIEATKELFMDKEANESGLYKIYRKLHPGLASTLIRFIFNTSSGFLDRYIQEALSTCYIGSQSGDSDSSIENTARRAAIIKITASDQYMFGYSNSGTATVTQFYTIDGVPVNHNEDDYVVEDNNLGKLDISNEKHKDALDKEIQYWFNLLDIDHDRLINLHYLCHMMEIYTTQSEDESGKQIRKNTMNTLIQTFIQADQDLDLQITFDEFSSVYIKKYEDMYSLLNSIRPMLKDTNPEFSVKNWKMYNGNKQDSFGEESAFVVMNLTITNPESYGLEKSKFYILYMVIAPPIGCTNLTYTVVESIICNPHMCSFYPMSQLDLSKYSNYLQEPQKIQKAQRLLMNTNVTNIEDFINQKSFEEQAISRNVAILEQKLRQSCNKLNALEETVNDLVRLVPNMPKKLNMEKDKKVFVAALSKLEQGVEQKTFIQKVEEALSTQKTGEQDDFIQKVATCESKKDLKELLEF